MVGDGLAVEFELPAEATRARIYEFAVQRQLPQPKSTKKRYIHGWQAIAEIPRSDEDSALAGLYISGVRWSERVSSLSLSGVKVHPRRSFVQVVPQVHLRLPSHFHFQVGAGAVRAARVSWQPLLAWRIIRELK